DFRREWIIAVGGGDDASMLLAVDAEHQIVGADRHARSMMALNRLRIEDGISIWSVLEWKPDLFRSKDRIDTGVVLVFAGGSEQPAIITPPEPSWQNGDGARLHTRPRLPDVRRVNSTAQAQTAPIRGGLSPSALRRVKDYVEANLEKR